MASPSGEMQENANATRMAGVNLEDHMMNFHLVIDNEFVHFHAEVPSPECLFLWMGQQSTATMTYGLLRHRSVIYGNPSPLSAIQINEFVSKLARLLGHRQVFVSTDIDQDYDVKFWTNLFLALKDFVIAHREFFRLPASVVGTQPSPQGASPLSQTSTASVTDSSSH